MALQQWLLLLGWFALLAAGVAIFRRNVVVAVFSLAAAITFAVATLLITRHW